MRATTTTRAGSDVPNPRAHTYLVFEHGQIREPRRILAQRVRMSPITRSASAASAARSSKSCEVQRPALPATRASPRRPRGTRQSREAETPSFLTRLRAPCLFCWRTPTRRSRSAKTTAREPAEVAAFALQRRALWRRPDRVDAPRPTPRARQATTRSRAS